MPRRPGGDRMGQAASRPNEAPVPGNVPWSVASLRELVQGLPDAVVGADGQATVVLVNDLAEELFGHPREHLVGGPISALWPERLRGRYSRDLALYFALEQPVRFTHEA